MNKNLVTGILAVVIAGALGFVGGMQYQKSQRSNLAVGNFAQNGMMRRFGGQGQNFRPVRGEVLSLDNNSMTVKLANGNSEIVILSPSTQYMKSASAAATDVKNGEAVMVIGTQNTDGSVTAQTVSLNPAEFQNR